MDIRELRYFTAVFEERSLTKAAARCFISQPSISLAVANLEAELGTALFIRHKKGAMPTEAAERFQTIARRIIDEADAARNLFRTEVPREVLKLGLMRTLDTARIIALLKPLTGRPNLRLHLVGTKERADARIISRSVARSDEHFLPLWTERYVAALPPSHPLTFKKRLTAADLLSVPMIDRCHCEQSALFARMAKPREVAAIAETEDWAMALVAAGVGVAIVPESVAQNHPEVTLREVEMSVKRQVGLAYSSSHAPTGALKTLIELFQPTPARQGHARRSGGKRKTAPKSIAATFRNT